MLSLPCSLDCKQTSIRNPPHEVGLDRGLRFTSCSSFSPADFKMRPSTLTNFWPWILHAALVAARHPGHATVQVLQPQRGISIWHALSRRDPASYELDPSTILWPPDCTTQDAKSCLGSSAVSTCTVEYCSKKVALTCWTHAYYIDIQCLCKSISSTTCSSCNAGINQKLYLAWLSR